MHSDAVTAQKAISQSDSVHHLRTRPDLVSDGSAAAVPRSDSMGQSVGMEKLSIEITPMQSAAAIDGVQRSVVASMWRGFRERCPACGVGKLFSKYLEVVDHCDKCGNDLHHQRADDAPPYFTIFIVGHVIVGGILWLEIALAPPMWLHLAIWLPLTLLMSLLLLPRIKGSLVGLQWALRMHGFGGAEAVEGEPGMPS